MPARIRKAASILFSLLIAACGGGSSDSTAVSASPLPASAATANGSTLTQATPAGETSSANTTPSNASANGSTTPGTETQASNFKLDENARFTDPSDLALDSTGNLYVMDRGERNIRRIASTGEVSVFSNGWDVRSRLATDAAGNLFVLSGTDIWKLIPNGSNIPDKLIYASYPQSPGTSHPVQISFDDQSRLYVLLQYRNKFNVARVDSDRVTRMYAYSYTEWGLTFDMTSDGQGNLAVGRIGLNNVDTVTWVPQSLQPADDTTAGLVTKQLALNSFGKMALDGNGNVYIADMTTTRSDNGPTFATDMRVIKLAPDGTVTTLLSGFPSGQKNSPRQLPSLYYTNIGLAVSKSGDVYVSVPTDQAIYKISAPGKVTLVAGKPAFPGSSYSN